MSLHLLRLMIYQIAAETEENGEEKSGPKNIEEDRRRGEICHWGRRWHSLHDLFTLTV